MTAGEMMSPGISAVWVLKEYAGELVAEVERCRQVAQYISDPLQAANAERVAWRHLKKAEVVCDTIRTLRLSA